MLYIHTSNRLEVLAGALCETLREPAAPVDVFQQEIVVVQSRGMARWLAMEMARRNGICGHTDFPFPNAFFDKVLSGLFPHEPGADPLFEPETLTWAVMGCLLKLEDASPEYGPLRRYLLDDKRGIKAHQLAGRIARLFDQYQVFRPDVIADWDKGGSDPDPEEAWQPEIWRELSRKGHGRHRADVMARVFEGLQRAAPDIQGMASRVSVFGISWLPPVFLRLFDALSRHVDVQLFLMNPCREFWGEIRSESAIARAAKGKGGAFSRDAAWLETGNRLLASLGTLGRDFLNEVTGLSGAMTEAFMEPEGNGLLHAIQSDILNLREPDPSRLKSLDPLDDTLRIHACHSPMREVQVLYDQVLSMFDADPGLKPEEILVMAPDIASYAPFIEAVFDAPGQGLPRIPFSIADRAEAVEDPAVQAFFDLVDMPVSRFEASRVLSLLERDCVRNALGLGIDDIGLCAGWVKASGIRWGVDARDRERLDLPGTDENTWESGLRRLLLGYALPGEDRRLFEGILPHEGVEGSTTRVLDGLVDFIHRLAALVENLSRSRTAGEWRQFFKETIEGFIHPGDDTRKGIAALHRAMDNWAGDVETAGFNGRLDPAVARAELERRLFLPSGAAGFLSGGVTFCAMLPMRAIPFKVIALLGMNLDAFPRKTPVSSFDLMVRSPRPGDRSSRNDDKYLFLETLLSARERLYISFVGRSLVDNTRLPPSVVVSELVDTVTTGYGKSEEELVTQHPLQAFSPSYFKPESGLFSYSRQDLEAARALFADSTRPPFSDRPLAVDESLLSRVPVEGLVRFFKNPARFFLEERLGVRLTIADEALADEENFSMDDLERFEMGNAVLETLKDGGDLMDLLAIYRQKGMVPHGGVGVAAFEKVRETAAGLWHRIEPVLVDPVPGGDVELSLGSVTLLGRFPERYGGRLVFYDYGAVNARRLLRAWVVHLFSQAAGMVATGKDTWLFCRDRQAVFSPCADPGETLRRLFSFYEEGQSVPLKFFPEGSLAAAKELVSGSDRESAMEEVLVKWNGYGAGRDEREEPHARCCFDPDALFDDAFFETAMGVYEPMLGHLTLKSKKPAPSG